MKIISKIKRVNQAGEVRKFRSTEVKKFRSPEV
jgi:hypothetical protein